MCGATLFLHVTILIIFCTPLATNSFSLPTVVCFLRPPRQAVPTILSNRRAGGARFGGGRIAGRVPFRGASSRLLDDRMRPLMTANGHGVHPVFCIKFDRTGQYIFTGADDALVKVCNRRVSLH